MTTSIQRDIWDYLPARHDRRRSTHPSVIAANIGSPITQVVAALAEMEKRGQVIQGRRGAWHRGMPLESPDEIALRLRLSTTTVQQYLAEAAA